MCGELTSSTSSLGSDQDSNLWSSDRKAQTLTTTPPCYKGSGSNITQIFKKIISHCHCKYKFPCQFWAFLHLILNLVSFVWTLYPSSMDIFNWSHISLFSLTYTADLLLTLHNGMREILLLYDLPQFTPHCLLPETSQYLITTTTTTCLKRWWENKFIIHNKKSEFGSKQTQVRRSNIIV